MCKLANPTSQSPGPSFIGLFSTLVKSVGDSPLLCKSKLRPCSLSELSKDEDMLFRLLTEHCEIKVPTMALYILWHHASVLVCCCCFIQLVFCRRSPPGSRGPSPARDLPPDPRADRGPGAGGRTSASARDGRRGRPSSFNDAELSFSLFAPHWCETPLFSFHPSLA